MKSQELTVASLYRHCDPQNFSFHNTGEVELHQEYVGQTRAIESIKFGIDIPHWGYNIFVYGPPGSGKQSITLDYLEKISLEHPRASDWCYLNNFKNPQKPLAVEFPSGQGAIFKDEMHRLIEDLHSSVLASLRDKELEQKRMALRDEYRQKETQMIEAIREKSASQDVLLIETPNGFVFTPVRNGEIISPPDYEKLSVQQKKEFSNKIDQLREDLEKALKEVHKLRLEVREKIKTMNEQKILQATVHLIESLKRKYAEMTKIHHYLNSVQADVLEHIEDFFTDQSEAEALKALTQKIETTNPFRRYDVNVLVAPNHHKGAPVIYENTPNLTNLVGSIEHVAKMGALLTDFMLIKAGALHRANGGYLVMDANKILMYPQAWDSLKKALKTEQIKIESLSEIYSMASTLGLEPEPIPLKDNIVLLGPAWLYYLLAQHDPDFFDFFKVGADFEDEIDWNHENENLYGKFISMVAHKEKLLPLSVAAVARVVEHSARIAGDNQKLTVRMMKISDLLKEAQHFALKSKSQTMEPQHIQEAIDFQTYRTNRIYQKMMEETLRKTLIIETEGGSVGSVNGLSVFGIEDAMYGHPCRITASVRIGNGTILDIQREVKMSGPSHAKGVLILTGFISSRYIIEEPLSVFASLVFEQTYGEVDGDSASLAETIALLSAIAQEPIHQFIAMTGSINQLGEVQAIGGVNQKIESFFDLCWARGLKGNEGVVIPKANVRHLMLKKEIRDAVHKGLFHVYAVSTVDECLEIMSSLKAGKPDAFKKFPKDSFNGKVELHLRKFAHKRTHNEKTPGSGE